MTEQDDRVKGSPRDAGSRAGTRDRADMWTGTFVVKILIYMANWMLV